MSSPTLTGYSAKNPLKYLGPNIALTAIVTRPRAPTGADIRQPSTGKYYSFGTMWIVGENPTTGSWGDLWYLGYIQANVGYWFRMETTSSTAAAFSAVMTNTVSNVTGDGTNYPIIFDTTSYSQNAAWDLPTSTFTAIVPGIYLFTMNVTLGNLSASFTSGHITINTQTHPSSGGYGNIGAMRDVGNIASVGISVVQKLSVGETTTFDVVVDGGTKSVSVVGNATTYVSGALVFQTD